MVVKEDRGNKRVPDLLKNERGQEIKTPEHTRQRTKNPKHPIQDKTRRTKNGEGKTMAKQKKQDTIENTATDSDGDGSGEQGPKTDQNTKPRGRGIFSSPFDILKSLYGTYIPMIKYRGMEVTEEDEEVQTDIKDGIDQVAKRLTFNARSIRALAEREATLELGYNQIGDAIRVLYKSIHGKDIEEGTESSLEATVNSESGEVLGVTDTKLSETITEPLKVPLKGSIKAEEDTAALLLKFYQDLPKAYNPNTPYFDEIVKSIAALGQVNAETVRAGFGVNAVVDGIVNAANALDADRVSKPSFLSKVLDSVFNAYTRFKARQNYQSLRVHTENRYHDQTMTKPTDDFYRNAIDILYTGRRITAAANAPQSESDTQNK